ncbi:MAG: MFS transporter [Bacteroidetes bacterium]|nr:MFS transporter [Bacteroidota bacterium]
MDDFSEEIQIAEKNSDPQKERAKNFSGNLKQKFSWGDTFAALRYRNYRLWFWGQMTSLFGTWMQTTALAFFVFELTHSPAFLGYVGFATGIPAWLFTFYAGVIADRYPRRTILLFTQSIMMLLAFLIAALTFTHIITPGLILMLAFFLGAANSFEAPARQAFVNELVAREELINAIALNSTMFNTATAIGPAIAGITYALFGPAWCFTINGISFVAVIGNLLQMKLPKVIKVKSEKSIFKDIKEGFAYLKSQKNIVVIMLVVINLNFFGMSLVTIFPAWAVNILHGDATTNGFLQSARGFGAVICALIIATVNKYIVRGNVLSITALTLPVLLFAFSFNRSLWLSLTLLMAYGAAIITMFNLANGLIQTMVTEEFRGRIMSIYSFGFFALFPVGALWIGLLAELFGSPTAILINSIILILISGLIVLRYPSLRTLN